MDELQAAGHLLSVAIPAASRSWIGKAHLIEASLTASYVHPDSFQQDGTWDTTSSKNGAGNGDEKEENDWVVITNGTPASCAQLGLYNLFTDRPPVDLVISGPNHGRNASTIYNLSSGTVGGALEAVFCGKRAIAISFGSKDEQPAEIISAAARLAVRIVSTLYRTWDERVELYNINIPMCANVETRPVRYARTLPYYWSKGCLYTETEESVAGDKKALTNGDVAVKKPDCNGAITNGQVDTAERKERHFKWSADLSDMKKSLQASEEGTDAHTVLNGSTRYVIIQLLLLLCRVCVCV